MSIKDLVIDWWTDHCVENGADGFTWFILVDDDDNMIPGTFPCRSESELADKYYDKAIEIVTDNLADMADMKRDEMRGG